MVSQGGAVLNLLSLVGLVMNYDLSVKFIRQWRMGQLNREKKLVFLSFGLFWILTMGNIPATLGFEIFPSSYIMFLPLGILSYQIVKMDSVHNKGKVAEIANRTSALNIAIIPLMMIFYYSQLSEAIDIYQRILHCITVGSPLIVGAYTITFVLSRPIAKELDSNINLLEVEKISLQKERELSESRRRIAIELANDLKFTNEITKEINASPDLIQIMKTVMNFMKDEFGIKHYGIFRLSPDKNYLIPYQISDTNVLSSDEKDKLMDIKIPFLIPESAHYLPYHSRRVLYFSKMKFKNIIPEDKEVMDIIQPKSYLFMPLVVNESVIGFLDFTNFRGEEFSLSKKNLTRIKSIADHIANSLHKIFLMDNMMETQKSNYDLAQKMQYLNEISKEFNETLDIETIKSKIVDYSISRIGLQHIAIWLVDPSKSYLYPYAGSYPEGISEDVIEKISLQRLIIDKDSMKGAHNIVYFKKRTIPLEGLDERYATEAEIFISKVYSLNRFIISPLIIKGEVIGIIYFQGQSTGRKTTRSQIKDIESFVQQISGSIYNASLVQNLNRAYTELQESQDQLVQSEKMAALGQLIAGVAHEINTPLGAIKASIENITHSLEESLNLFPDYITNLSIEQKNMFFALIEKAKRDKRTLSTKEDRKWKSELRNTLEANEIPKSDEIADSLVDIGIYDGVEPFLPLFQSYPDDTIQLAYNLAGFQIKAKNIKSAVEKASKIVFALKNYAHSDSTGQKILSNIIEGIETVLTIYQNSFKKGVELHTEFDLIPTIYCYPDELNQIWTNLIHNSLQAMDYNGKLYIRAFTESSVKEDSGKENNENASEEFIVVQIEDSGPGIPLDLQEKIFNPFFTTKKRGEGSGLGLHITRKILDKHNGNLSLDSTPGRTVFTIKIPMLKKQEKIS
jgi:signal transduction histidine kinase